MGLGGGLGFGLGAPRARSHLEIRVVSERFTWTEKNGDAVRSTSSPVRFLADGFLESGPWRLDLGRWSVSGLAGWASRGYDLSLPQQAGRTVPEPGPLPARQEDLYLDKAHLKALYEFRPRVSFELLLSQALRGGSFGGGSIKALLVF